LAADVSNGKLAQVVGRMVNCLRDETIAAFVGGALDEIDLRRVDEHLAGCSDCRGVIADAAYGALEQTGTPPSNDAQPAVGHASEPGSEGGRGLVPALAPGDVIADKYEVEHLLGSGGMGQVFAARHLELGQRVAIKVLDHRGPTAAARFLREARTSANLVSDHVPRVFDVGRLPAGAPYLVMEYLVGQDLRRLLEDRGPIDATDAVAYLLDACAAVAGAHAAGIVHRDLKPANLLLTSRADGQPLVKVLDFGVSKVMGDDDLPAPASDQGLTSTGVVLGSPLYMSPEQVRARKDIDARTDVWSLGAILFELLSGRPPFRAPTLPALAVAIAVESPPALSSLRSDLPDGLELITQRCLEKRPELRFQSVDELARALRPLLSTAREEARSWATIDPASAPAPRRRLVAALAIGGALVVGGVAVRFAQNPRGALARDRDTAAKKPDVVAVSPTPPPVPGAPMPVTVQATAAATAPPAAFRSPSAASPARPATRRRTSRPGPLDTPD
jgi:serine/threonine-protein kinase